MRSFWLIVVLVTFSLTAHAQTDRPILTPENAAQVTQLERYGTGKFHNSAAWSPDGSALVVATAIGVVTITDTGEQLTDLSDYQGAYSVTYSPDGEQIAVGTGDGHLVVLAAGGERAAEPAHLYPVSAVVWSPDGSRIASADWSGVTRVWDAASLTEIAVISAVGLIESLAFSPDSQHIAAAGREMTGVWRIEDSTELLNVSLDNVPEQPETAFAPESYRVMFTLDDRIEIYEEDLSGADRYELLHTIPVERGRFVDLGLNDEGIYAIARTNDGLRLLDVLLLDQWRELDINAAYPQYVLYNPARDQLFALQDDEFHVYNADGTDRVVLNSVHEFTSVGFQIGEDGVLSVCGEAALYQRCFSLPDAPPLSPTPPAVTAEAGIDSVIRLRNASGSVVAQLYGHRRDVNAIAFSPDGTLIASASNDGTIQLWDARVTEDSGALAVLDAHLGTVRDVEFTPDGTMLASAGFDGTLRLWGINP